MTQGAFLAYHPRVLIRTSRDNVRSPQYMEQALAAFHAVGKPFSLSIVRTDRVRLYVEGSETLHKYLYAQYPELDIMEGSPQFVGDPVHLRLSKLDVLPIRRYPQFDDMLERTNVDPIASLCAAAGAIRIEAIPVDLKAGKLAALPDTMRARFLGRLCLRGGLWSFLPVGGSVQDDAGTRSHDREVAVQGALDKSGRPLFRCRVSVWGGEGMVGAFGQFTGHNSFKKGKAWCILSNEELATIWHPPLATVSVPGLDRVESKRLEPKESGEGVTLGEAVFRGRTTIARAGNGHLYTIGKTGQGKSTLLLNAICEEMQTKGVGVIDPHGDLIEDILRRIPSNRVNDVILVDPSDKEFPMSFNLLRESQNPELLVSGILAVFAKLWPNVWSARMEHITRNCLMALVEHGGSSLLGVPRILSDSRFRESVLTKVRDPLVLSFWREEYGGWTERYRTEAIAPIQNKIGQLLSSTIIRNMVGQVKNKLDLRQAMQDGRIVIVNLSKGRLGQDVSAFLGSMFVTRFQLDAMSRAWTRERAPFSLYVDEFQNFATPTFATMLSESRKYNLQLRLANQYVQQLVIEHDTSLRDAVLGNSSCIVSFQVGSDDAEYFAKQFEDAVTPQDILGLPKYHAYARTDSVFLLRSRPPMPELEDQTEKIRRLSRNRYAEDRSTVERKITKWFGT